MHRFRASVQSILRQPGFAGLLAANFALGLAYSFVVPFMSMWGTLEVGMSSWVFGAFMTVTTLSSIVLSLLLARWSDTFVPRRTMMIIGSLGGLLGYLGYAFIRDVVVLTLVGCFVLGVATVNFSQLFAHIREELSRPENRSADAPFLMSILRVSFSLAWTVGPALGAWVMVMFGYRGLFGAASALFAVFLFGILRYVPHRPRPAQSSQVKQPSLARVLTRPDILSYFSAFVLVFAAHSICLMNLPLMVTQRLGGTEGQVGLIFGLAPVIEVPLMIWFGKLAAAGHQVGLIRMGVILSALYFVALSMAGSPWHIFPMQVLTAISIAITTNITILFFQDLLPGQAGLATSIYSNSFSTGSLVGYFIFGSLLPALGHRGMFLLCAGLSAVAIVIVFTRRRADAVRLPVAPVAA